MVRINICIGEMLKNQFLSSLCVITVAAHTPGLYACEKIMWSLKDFSSETAGPFFTMEPSLEGILRVYSKKHFNPSLAE